MNTQILPQQSVQEPSKQPKKKTAKKAKKKLKKLQNPGKLGLKEVVDKRVELLHELLSDLFQALPETRQNAVFQACIFAENTTIHK